MSVSKSTKLIWTECEPLVGWRLRMQGQHERRWSQVTLVSNTDVPTLTCCASV